MTNGSERSRAYGTEATDPGWGGGVCDTKVHRRTGIRADQTGARIPTVSITRTGEGTRGVGSDLHDSQHTEVSQDHLQRIAEQLPGKPFTGSRKGLENTT